MENQSRDISTEVIKLLCDLLSLKKHQVTGEKLLMEELGADHFDKVEIALALEDEWDIEINDDEIDNLKTVSNCIGIVEEKTQRR